MDRLKLVEELVSLSSSRIDIYYHSTTNTHLVCQKEEVIFGNFAIKGSGDFADDALVDFSKKIQDAAHSLDDCELQRAISLCKAIPPKCTKKFELQVSISEGASEIARSKAKTSATSVELFIEALVNRSLPEFVNRNELLAWAEHVKSSRVRNETPLLTSAVSLPLTRREFGKMKLAVEVGAFNDFSHLLEELIAFELSDTDKALHVKH